MPQEGGGKEGGRQEGMEGGRQEGSQGGRFGEFVLNKISDCLRVGTSGVASDVLVSISLSITLCASQLLLLLTWQQLLPLVASFGSTTM